MFRGQPQNGSNSTPKPNPSKIIGNLQQIIRIMFELCGGNEQRMHKNCLRTLDGRLRTICGHLWRDFSQGLMDFTIFAKCSIHVGAPTLSVPLHRVT